MACLSCVRVLAEPFRNDVLLESELATTHLARKFLEMVMNALDDYFLVFLRKNATKNVAVCILGLNTPISPHEIETLGLRRID